MAISKSLTSKMSGTFSFFIFILGGKKGSCDSITTQFSGGIYISKTYKVSCLFSFPHVYPRVQLHFHVIYYTTS